MRSRASILHLDLDAFFASVEQRDKPSLRGKPVVVGGIGQRGVVATASYEARTFGVRSAMPTHEARRRCPNAAFLVGRFESYRSASRAVMEILRSVSPLVEPLSLDEAFVDLEASTEQLDLSEEGVREFASSLRARVGAATGGLTASIGIGSSKFIAKLATELAKPDGCRVVPAGTEVDLIAPMSASVIPGVGPVTRERLARLGVRTIRDLQQASAREITRELGRAQGQNLLDLAFARDNRRVEAEREAKSISVEDTFEIDERDPKRLEALVDRDAGEVARRLAAAGLFARTVTIKVRLPDFTTYTRAHTLNGATDNAREIASMARGLLGSLDLSQGVRLLGVGVSGLTEIAQPELFSDDAGETEVDRGEVTPAAEVPHTRERRLPTSWLPGVDVIHTEWGAGWVWGSGVGRVTVRFETAETGPGPVRTFAIDDPELRLAHGADPVTPRRTQSP